YSYASIVAATNPMFIRRWDMLEQGEEGQGPYACLVRDAEKKVVRHHGLLLRKKLENETPSFQNSANSYIPSSPQDGAVAAPYSLMYSTQTREKFDKSVMVNVSLGNRVRRRGLCECGNNSRHVNILHRCWKRVDIIIYVVLTIGVVYREMC
nr:hypothetical protein [Tanacetum cinerariifolium]